MKNSIIIPENIEKKYSDYRETCSIFVFSGFCGIGKTAVVHELLRKEKRKITTFDFEHSSNNKNSSGILIENAHRIQSKDQQQKLVEFIRTNTQKRFYILTRSKLPHWLLSFQLTENLQVFYGSDFIWNQEETKDYLKDFSLKHEEIVEIYNQTEGYPLFISMIACYLHEGNRFLDTTCLLVKERLYYYLTEYVFDEFSEKSRYLLLCVSLFNQFDVEFMKMVSGEIEVLQIIEEIQHESNVLKLQINSTYTITPFFQEYLQWKLSKEYKEEEIRRLYSCAGRYYELNQQTILALDCYGQSKEERKFIKILVDNSDKNPVLGDYLELEPYYLGLPEEEIKNSPSLMAGMSMLKCMRANYEESTDWYNQLVEYSEKMKKSDREYKTIKAKLIYLEIALPQFGTENLLTIFSQLFRLLTNNEVSLPRFSITSLLPSILNGGKDFSPWTKNDLTIYKTMRIPCETVLGKDGVGVFDCAICESLFEKGRDYNLYLVEAMAKLTQIQQNGTHEIEFYLMGLMARIQVYQGNSESAKETLYAIENRFHTLNENRFHGNIQAMLCKIGLLQGDYKQTEQWLEKVAPKDDFQIWTLLRLQYLVKCEVYIRNGDFFQALRLLSQLRTYTLICKRPIDRIQTNCLMSICYYRQNDVKWRENMAEALAIAYEYEYIYPIAQYGTAILPLLIDYERKEKNKHFTKILAITRKQASIYQRYLEPISEVVIQLSPSELAVLRLICQNKSNAEIGSVLNIKLPTVKAHTANIFRKMNVSRRSEAKTEAKRLNLIDEYLAQ
ncbi:MAG: LuxR C-terminal-related transcriptional regulator [Eubacteriales bacterium]